VDLQLNVESSNPEPLSVVTLE